MKIGIVLPVYNEENEIKQVLANLEKQNLPVFAVNDGSVDKTSEIFLRQSKKSSKINIYSHKINLGKGAAIKTGCEAAFNSGIDAIIMMDSDGQHSLNDLKKFIEKLNTKKYDMVLGSRNLHHGVPIVRFLGNKFASVLISLLFRRYFSDILRGFRGITKRGYKKIKIESSGYGLETEMVIKASKLNLKTCEVPIETIYHDKHKGVTIVDAFSILLEVIRWRIII